MTTLAPKPKHRRLFSLLPFGSGFGNDVPIKLGLEALTAAKGITLAVESEFQASQPAAVEAKSPQEASHESACAASPTKPAEPLGMLDLLRSLSSADDDGLLQERPASAESAASQPSIDPVPHIEEANTRVTTQDSNESPATSPDELHNSHDDGFPDTILMAYWEMDPLFPVDSPASATPQPPVERTTQGADATA